MRLPWSPLPKFDSSAAQITTSSGCRVRLRLSSSVATTSSAAIEPTSPSKLPPPRTESMCDPNRIGAREGGAARPPAQQVSRRVDPRGEAEAAHLAEHVLARGDVGVRECRAAHAVGEAASRRAARRRSALEPPPQPSRVDTRRWHGVLCPCARGGEPGRGGEKAPASHARGLYATTALPLGRACGLDSALCFLETPMRFPSVLLTIPIVLASALEAPAEEPLIGFGPSGGDRPARALEARFDAELRRGDIRDWVERLSSRPHHVGSAWGKDNAEWMARLFRSWGYDTTIETYEVLFPTPKARLVEMLAPQGLPRRARRAAARRGRDLGPGGRAAADVQRLLEGRRRDRRARVRELRRARGLRGARAARHRRQGQDRDRALRPLVARHQAEGRGRARRHRLPDLLRPARRRLLRRATPTRRAATAARRAPSAARWRTCRSTRATRSRPVWARRRTPSGCRSSAPRRSRRSRCCRSPTATRSPLLEALGGPVAPEGWRGALPITYHLGPGPAKVRLSLAFDWKRVPAYDVIARLAGRRGARAVGDPRQPPRRVGERRDRSLERHGGPARRGQGDRRAGEPAASSRAARSCSPAGTPRSPACSARPSGSSTTRRSSARRPSPTSTPTATAGASSTWPGSHSLQRLLNEVARDVADPAKGTSVAERVARPGARRTRRRGAQARARARGDPARRARLGLGLHAVPAAPRHRLAQRRLRRRGRLRPVPLDLRLVRPLRALHGPRLRLRRGAREGGRPGGAAARAGGALAVRVQGPGRGGRRVRLASSRRSPTRTARRDGAAQPGRSSAARSRRWRRRTSGA